MIELHGEGENHSSQQQQQKLLSDDSDDSDWQQDWDSGEEDEAMAIDLTQEEEVNALSQVFVLVRGQHVVHVPCLVFSELLDCGAAAAATARQASAVSWALQATA